MGALEVKRNKGSKNTEENKKLRPLQKSKESEEFGLSVRSMKKKIKYQKHTDDKHKQWQYWVVFLVTHGFTSL